MGVNKYNIKKWWNMIRGKSIYHVNQGVGKVYSFDEIKGYYNDLTEKVLKNEEKYDSTEVFKTRVVQGEVVHTISIFQYGLAAYDLILLGHDIELMKKKFISFLNWAFDNQNTDGSWDAFSFKSKEHPFSSMAQGEGASLLIRGYVFTGDKKYLDAAKKALDFMLLPISEGGTSVIEGDKIILYEFTNYPFVFNGWIFSIFGLIDYVTITKDEYYRTILNKTINTFKNNIQKMDNGYWSKYSDDKKIASPFYHSLHISLLEILYQYTGDKIFKEYKDLFSKYASKKANRNKAFIKKAFQKIKSKDD
ncbi:MAG: D-glucuronyl C5-epimerase family protein [Erysipelotrichaceae bacterium]|jgi:hypothetical protein|nr:D-glucuronyl C5-epimerase family protein [Erysipelotrichaceae bacterium]